MTDFLLPGVTLESPYPFRERLCLFGGGGAGKTTAVLSIARRTPTAHFHIIDTDVSDPYVRALYLEFPDVAERDQVTIHRVYTWEQFVEAIESIVESGDHDRDWFVFDNITWAWTTVQSWMSEQAHGDDIADFMVQLKRETKDLKDPIKEFNAQMSEGMNWPVINKQYQSKVMNRLHRWHGHFVITAEAKEIPKKDADELQMIYGHVGVYPAGQKSLHHVAATNLFMHKVKAGGRIEFRITTVKDRGREEVEHHRVGVADDPSAGDFAMNYLRDVAGWKMRPPVKVKAAS